jgi:hypothetical protein
MWEGRVRKAGGGLSFAIIHARANHHHIYLIVPASAPSMGAFYYRSTSLLLYADGLTRKKQILHIVEKTSTDSIDGDITSRDRVFESSSTRHLFL